MKILALDTSMQACSAAVLTSDATNGGRLFASYEEFERGHAERLMAMIDETMHKASTSIAQIDRFCVSRGPGTFTGVRIGIATARALGLACHKPVEGMGTLEIMAARVCHERLELTNSIAADLAIAVDARRDQVYWQLFNKEGTPLGKAMAVAPQQAADLVIKRGKPVMLAGSGAELVARYLDRDEHRFNSSHPALQPHAAHLAERCADRIRRNNPPLQSASPLYLRPADAKTQSGFAIERQET